MNHDAWHGTSISLASVCSRERGIERGGEGREEDATEREGISYLAICLHSAYLHANLCTIAEE